jgi:hypothetical protein
MAEFLSHLLWMFNMDNTLTQQEFNKIKNTPMVFIMGKERSGTTLLQTFLDTNPSIVGPPESEFIVLLYSRFGKIRKWSEKDIYNFIEELYKEPWITKIWRIDRKLLTDMLISIKDVADYASICKVIYYCMRRDKENILWISDKNPMYVIFINTLLKIFPEAKFIHLIRDPRDNVNSHLNSFKVKNVRFLSMRWLYYNIFLNEVKMRVPGKFHTLLYESMVENPELEMKKICAFLNIPFSGEMVKNTFPERLKSFTGQKLIHDRVLDIHANLLKPVNTSNIGKWRTEMSRERIEIVESITGAFAAKNYGYRINAESKPIYINKIKNLNSRVVYYCWQLFTQIRYNNYRFNRLYTKFNILIGRETRVFGKVLRES